MTHTSLFSDSNIEGKLSINKKQKKKRIFLCDRTSRGRTSVYSVPTRVSRSLNDARVEWAGDVRGGSGRPPLLPVVAEADVSGTPGESPRPR